MSRRLIRIESKENAAIQTVKLFDVLTGQPIHNCKRMSLTLDADNIFIEGTMTIFKTDEAGNVLFTGDPFGNVSPVIEEVPVVVTEVNLTAHVTDITE